MLNSFQGYRLYVNQLQVLDLKGDSESPGPSDTNLR